MKDIQKLKNGRKVSIQNYNQAKAEFEEAYANATPEEKAELDKLMKSSQGYSAADPMNNRSAREYAT